MYSLRRFTALSIAVCFLTGFGTVSQAQSRGAVAATARVTAPVEAGRTIRLKGYVPNWATAANDLGSVSATRRLDNLHLILARSTSRCRRRLSSCWPISKTPTLPAITSG